MIILFSALLILVFAGEVWHSASWTDREARLIAWEISTDILEPLPKGAILFAGYDMPLFNLWYAQYVGKERPDVLVVAGGDPSLVKLPRWYEANLRKDFPELFVSITDVAAKRPVFTIDPTERSWGKAASNFRPVGLTYRFDEQWQDLLKEDLVSFFTLPSPPPFSTNSVTHPYTKEILKMYATSFRNAGVAVQKKGDLPRAKQLYDQALLIDPGALSTLVNRAAVALDLGDLDEAEQLYNKALKQNPYLEPAQNGLRLIEERRKQQ